MASIVEVDLEERCEACDGSGSRHSEQSGRRRCGMCGGSGFVATAFGEKVLALMRHNFRPLLEDSRGSE